MAVQDFEHGETVVFLPLPPKVTSEGLEGVNMSCMSLSLKGDLATSRDVWLGQDSRKLSPSWRVQGWGLRVGALGTIGHGSPKVCPPQGWILRR
jgi:hypothetical protein